MGSKRESDRLLENEMTVMKGVRFRLVLGRSNRPTGSLVGGSEGLVPSLHTFN